MNKEIILNLGDIKVLSELLSPTYLDKAFDKKINDSIYTIKEENRFQSCKIIKNSTKDKTINEIYTEIFQNFSKNYLEWYNNIMTNENKKNITIKRSKKHLSRIESKLEPIKFTSK
jgi:hypothetical protein